MRKYPLATTYVIGADYEQSRRGFFATMINILEEQLHWKMGRDFEYRETPSPVLTLLDTRAKLRSLSAQQAERIRSVEIQTLVCEEPQTWMDGERVYRVLSGRLRHSLRSKQLYPEMSVQARLSFNPPVPANGHWLYTLTAEAWPELGYPCYRFSTRDNYLLHHGEQYIRTLEATLPKELWPAEIEGEWVFGVAGVYRSFDWHTHVHELGAMPVKGLPPLAFDKSRPIWWSHDFNVHKMCSVIGQVQEQHQVVVPFDSSKIQFHQKFAQDQTIVTDPRWQSRIMYVIDELVVRDAGIPDVVEAFVARYGDIARSCGVILCGDASGSNRAHTISSRAAARSNWEIMQELLARAGIPVEMKLPRENPPVRDRINAVNVQLSSGEGPGMLISKGCNEIATDLISVRWNENGDLDKRDMERTHMSDALGYFVWQVRGNQGNIDIPRSLMER